MNFGSEFAPSKLRSGDPISKAISPSRINESSDAIREIGQHMGRNLGPTVQSWNVVNHFLARIYQSGSQAKYSDARYEVEVQQVKWSLATDDLIDTEKNLLPEEARQIVTAANLAELDQKSHLLAIDAIVHCFGVVLDKGTGPAYHNFFYASPPGALFAVKVVKTGGSNGNKTTAASWTYTVKTLAGKTITTGTSLTRPRPKGTATVQADNSYGLAFYDGSTLILWDAGEIYGTGAC